MFQRFLIQIRPKILGANSRFVRCLSNNIKDEFADLVDDEVIMEDIDEIMANSAMSSLDTFYPNLDVAKSGISQKPLKGHNVCVIQPWSNYLNKDLSTDPYLQLEECVSLVNTVNNWKVIDKKIVFSPTISRVQVLKPKAFEELKDTIRSLPGVSAVMFGLEILSAMQKATIEKELNLAVYDRFTTVLNIFRQHARTKEAKLQLALAEIPYIRGHLREIHESAEYSSSSDSFKLLVGGNEDRRFNRRKMILNQREARLKQLLNDLRKQRVLNKKKRTKTSDAPVVSVVGYTNAGKTTLIKYLTQDAKLNPMDQLFATLDVSVHLGQLPSHRDVFFMDTVGFLSRIPLLLIEAFSATLQDVKESDLILHVCDVSHPDYRLQYTTVIKALESLGVSKELLRNRITIGNKYDMLSDNKVEAEVTTDAKDNDPYKESRPPRCDLLISATKGTQLTDLVKLVDSRLLEVREHKKVVIRVDNGGPKYFWLRKNATIIECSADPDDGNTLICKCNISPARWGRWLKMYGLRGVEFTG